MEDHSHHYLSDQHGWWPWLTVLFRLPAVDYGTVYRMKSPLPPYSLSSGAVKDYLSASVSHQPDFSTSVVVYQFYKCKATLVWRGHVYVLYDVSHIDQRSDSHLNYYFCGSVPFFTLQVTCMQRISKSVMIAVSTSICSVCPRYGITVRQTATVFLDVASYKSQQYFDVIQSCSVPSLWMFNIGIQTHFAVIFTHRVVPCFQSGSLSQKVKMYIPRSYGCALCSPSFYSLYVYINLLLYLYCCFTVFRPGRMSP